MLNISEDGKKLSFGRANPPPITKCHSQEYDQTTLLSQTLSRPSAAFRLEDFSDLERIGSGKFGKVYSCVEKTSGRKVALKTVYKKLLGQFEFYSQMKKELEIQYRLSIHPNIAQLHAYFHDSQCVYSVLEFVAEGNLY